MRGKAEPVAPKFTIPGITPAYAGKRLQSCLRIGVKKDHPRLCGEKVYNFTQNIYSPGSPPPMRGKAYGYHKTEKQLGITPAYAGKRESPS